MSPNLKNKYLALHEKYGDIKITCQGASALPLDVIADFQGNLKKRTQANKIKLAELIFRLGFSFPFFVWQHEENYYNLDGHGRSNVLCEIRQSGIQLPDLFPVAYIEADSEKQAREKLLAASSSYGDFNRDILENDWLKNLDEDLRNSLRFIEKELNISIQKETEEDDIIPENIKPITKLGDLWELGNHRLLCGDSMDEKQVNRLMEGEKVDMIFTDPPYPNNSNIFEDQIQGIEKVFEIIYPKVNYLISWFWHNILLPPIKKKITAKWIWAKTNGFQAGHYESIYCYHTDKKDRENVVFHLRNVGQDIIRKNIANHPSPKPVDLLIQILEKWKNNYKIIGDLFLGSGSTLIACEKTDRICYGMELDPYYCDVIVNRYIAWCKKNKREINIKLNGEEHNY